MKAIRFLAATAIVVSMTSSVYAFPPATLAQWTFEVSQPATAGPNAAEGGVNAGAGSPSTGSHAGAAVYSTPVGNGSAHSFSSTLWAVGDNYQSCTSTSGYAGVVVDWDQASSNTGPRDFQLQYNVNGGGYSNFGGTYAVLANAAPNPLWSSATNQAVYHFSVDLSSITALDNVASICIRMTNNSTVSANGGSVGTGGTDRVDNVTIAATATPEPTTISLLALGALGLIRRRK